jgi:hypothetical protein
MSVSRRCMRCGTLFASEGPLDTVCSSTCREPRRRQSRSVFVKVREKIRAESAEEAESGGQEQLRHYWTKRCEDCESLFEANHRDAKYCSQKCQKRAYRKVLYAKRGQ